MLKPWNHDTKSLFTRQKKRNIQVNVLQVLCLPYQYHVRGHYQAYIPQEEETRDRSGNMVFFLPFSFIFSWTTVVTFKRSLPRTPLYINVLRHPQQSGMFHSVERSAQLFIKWTLHSIVFIVTDLMENIGCIFRVWLKQAVKPHEKKWRWSCGLHRHLTVRRLLVSTYQPTRTFCIRFARSSWSLYACSPGI